LNGNPTSFDTLDLTKRAKIFCLSSQAPSNDPITYAPSSHLKSVSPALVNPDQPSSKSKLMIIISSSMAGFIILALIFFLKLRKKKESSAEVTRDSVEDASLITRNSAVENRHFQETQNE
jgi:hypothetical protein